MTDADRCYRPRLLGGMISKSLYKLSWIIYDLSITWGWALSQHLGVMRGGVRTFRGPRRSRAVLKRNIRSLSRSLARGPRRSRHTQTPTVHYITPRTPQNSQKGPSHTYSHIEETSRQPPPKSKPRRITRLVLSTLTFHPPESTGTDIPQGASLIGESGAFTRHVPRPWPPDPPSRPSPAGVCVCGCVGMWVCWASRERAA